MLHLVSTFPPARDGIARYADQLERDLVARGVAVQRIGLRPGLGDRQLELAGGVRPLRLLRATARGDELLVMWHPTWFLRGGSPRRAVTYLALGAVLRRRRTTIVVHEPGPTVPRDGGRFASTERRARRWAWSGAAAIELHSARERDAFLTEVGVLPPDRLRVRAHHAAMVPALDLDRDEARRRLGLADGHAFLCIGFIGGHKGFDRAVDGFDGLAATGARLYLVGSVLEGHPEGADHLRELRELVADRPGVELRECYLSDEDFDVWLQAADTLLLPYRSIASSGVFARARVLGTPVVASDVGALPEQAGAADTIVRSDAELRAVMAARAGLSSG